MVQIRLLIIFTLFVTASSIDNQPPDTWQASRWNGFNMLESLQLHQKDVARWKLRTTMLVICQTKLNDPDEKNSFGRWFCAREMSHLNPTQWRNVCVRVDREVSDWNIALVAAKFETSFCWKKLFLICLVCHVLADSRDLFSLTESLVWFFLFPERGTSCGWRCDGVRVGWGG